MTRIILFIIFQMSLFLTFGQKRKYFITVDTTDLIVYYDYHLQRDSLDKSSSSINDMVLAIGKNRSLFVGARVFFSNPIIWQGDGKSNFNEVMAVASKYRRGALAFFYIIKNYPTEEDITTRLSILGAPRILVKEPLNLMDWELHDEELQIGHYLCKKATTHFAGRDYVAWYTLEVPVSDGPYKFNGLPGLIVNIEDTNGEHRFELTGIEDISADKMPMRFIYEKHKTIDGTMDDYLRALSAWTNGGSIVLSNSGLQITDPGFKDNVIKGFRKRNNFIEKRE